MGLGVCAVPMFKIYVGNLDPRVKIEQVRELFSALAEIEDAVLAVDAKTGKPKGFAIIMIRDADIGRAAVKAVQGKRLLGKTLTINEVMKKGAAKAAKEVRQGPFGPHFNRQGGGRAGGMRRGMNRGLRGPSAGGATGGFSGGRTGGSSYGGPRPGASGPSGFGDTGPGARPQAFPPRPDAPRRPMGERPEADRPGTDRSGADRPGADRQGSERPGRSDASGGDSDRS
jgi:RNA recognition motif-containing protein